MAAIWYLTVTAMLSVGQYYIERRFDRGFARGAVPVRRRAAADGSAAPAEASPAVELERLK